MTTIVSRTNSITHWLTHTLKLDIQQFEPASSDASFRRYFRVTDDKGQQIVMDAPPEKENTEPFIRLANLFKNSGLNVPSIYQQDLEQGFLLIEDFGSSCFLDQLNDKTALDLYRSAFNSLITLQTNVPTNSNDFPQYDQALLHRELDIFYDWFLQQHLALSIPDSIKNTLNQVLITSALDQPKVCVHRDFHSRNLMVLPKNSPGIIDFQDAVIGPITYDLVSLLRDCYISWPDKKVNQWMMLYYQQITDLGIINTDPTTFSRWFDLMGLQRHLKAIGIFTRLHIRDNKSHYLNDIPRTMHYVTQICDIHPELAEFNRYLKETVLDAYNRKKQ